MNLFEHIVKENEVGYRLDKLLVDINGNYSRQQIQQWIKNEHVKVNEKKVKANYKCKLSDKITWSIVEEMSLAIEGENIPLHILYEDEQLIVINKEKGMLVHPTNTVHSGTLVNALKFHTNQLSTLSGEERPGIVHRLDQFTSGLLVVAKDNETHLSLKNQFKNKTVTRIYEAVVHGVVQHNNGIIQAPIGRNPKNRLLMTVISTGKQAETHFEVIERFQNYTHVECQLITGRTHQIRVHMKYMNHPIVGDELYSRKQRNLIEHQALFAKKLAFIHPKTNKKLTFEINQPTDFNKLLQTIS